MARSSEKLDITSSVFAALNGGILFIYIGITKGFQNYTIFGFTLTIIALLVVLLAFASKYCLTLREIAIRTNRIVPVVILPATIFAMFYKYIELLGVAVNEGQSALIIFYVVTAILGITYLGWVIQTYQSFTTDVRRKSFKILALDLVFSVLINYWVLHSKQTEKPVYSDYLVLGIAMLLLIRTRFWNTNNNLQKALLVFGCTAVLFGAAAASGGIPLFDISINITSMGMILVCIATILAEGNLFNHLSESTKP